MLLGVYLLLMAGVYGLWLSASSKLDDDLPYWEMATSVSTEVEWNTTLRSARNDVARRPRASGFGGCGEGALDALPLGGVASIPKDRR